jgi:hypothetical protein
MKRYNLCHKSSTTYLFYLYQRMPFKCLTLNVFISSFLLFLLDILKYNDSTLKLGIINITSFLNKRRYALSSLSAYLSHVMYQYPCSYVLNTDQIDHYNLFINFGQVTGLSFNRQINKNYFTLPYNSDIHIIKHNASDKSDFNKSINSKCLFHTTYNTNPHTIVSTKFNSFSDSSLVPWNKMRSIRNSTRVFTSIPNIDLLNIQSSRISRSGITKLNPFPKSLLSYKNNYTEYAYNCFCATTLISSRAIYSMSDKLINYYRFLYLVNRDFMNYKKLCNWCISTYNNHKKNTLTLLRYNNYLYLLYSYSKTKWHIMPTNFINGLAYLSISKKDFFNKYLIFGKTTFKHTVLEQTKIMYLNKIKSI